MSGIPPELLFVLIFIAFSVLEGVGRKKKANREGGAKQPSAPPHPSPRDREGVVSPPGGRGPEPSPSASKAGPASSEGMIPEDVWAEILGLARGTETKPAPKPEPGPEPVQESSWDSRRVEDETLEEIPAFEARSLEPLEARPDVIRADWNRAPASPSRRVQPPLAAPASVFRPRGGGKARRELFGGGTAKELQKAIILQEVLGPPVGLKE